MIVYELEETFMFDLDNFISKNVTKRSCSMFTDDIKKYQKELEKKIEGKTVLVIGGAGSIGSSFVKAVLQFKPKTLVVVDINENGLAELTRNLRSTLGMYIPEDYVTYPMSFASKTFEKMFKKRGGFDIVANFSAHKHVRSEKDVFSIEALLKNNVIDAKKLLELISNYPPEEYFCVSTDKAANPVNIMGASKRIMEDLIFAYSDKFPVKTARFANVAFSNGSLPLGFIERLSKKQPLSAPSDVKRFFVSPEESGQICMLSCMLGDNREIFFPKLKEEQMMKFDTIAELLLEEYGYIPDYCDTDNEAILKASSLKSDCKMYPVHFSESNTSGEKQYEEFYTCDETVDMDRFMSLGVIKDKEMPDDKKLNVLLGKIETLFEKDFTKSEIVEIIKEYLPNFDHIETGKSLDSKM